MNIKPPLTPLTRELAILSGSYHNLARVPAVNNAWGPWQRRFLEVNVTQTATKTTAEESSGAGGLSASQPGGLSSLTQLVFLNPGWTLSLTENWTFIFRKRSYHSGPLGGV